MDSCNFVRFGTQLLDISFLAGPMEDLDGEGIQESSVGNIGYMISVIKLKILLTQHVLEYNISLWCFQFS